MIVDLNISGWTRKVMRSPEGRTVAQVEGDVQEAYDNESGSLREKIELMAHYLEEMGYEEEDAVSIDLTYDPMHARSVAKND